MTQELEAAAPSERDKLMTTELVPEQILPKVMSTFGLTAAYVFIICWITGSSVMATGGWTAIPMWVLGILTFLVPAGMAVVELGNLWPGQAVSTSGPPGRWGRPGASSAATCRGYR